MVASTESPTRSSRAVGWYGARTDFYRQALHDLGEVAGGVVRLQRRERRTRRSRNVQHVALKVDVLGVNVNAGALAGSDMAELDFSVICFDVDFRKRHHCHQGGTGTHVVAQLHAALRDHSVHWSQNLGVGQIELRLVALGFGLFETRDRAGALRL
jgi:hypothetical protein